MLSNLVSQNNTDYITLHIGAALESSCLIAVLNYGKTRLIEPHKDVSSYICQCIVVFKFLIP